MYSSDKLLGVGTRGGRVWRGGSLFSTTFSPIEGVRSFGRDSPGARLIRWLCANSRIGVAAATARPVGNFVVYRRGAAPRWFYRDPDPVE
jgi:hypothetical protein